MKCRSDFVSNSSSSSFIILESENYGIFRGKPTKLTWNEYSMWYLRSDCLYGFTWYQYDQYDDGWNEDYTQKLREPGFKCKLIDLIDYTFTDEQFAERWKTSNDDDLQFWYPPSCENIVEELIPIAQTLAELDREYIGNVSKEEFQARLDYKKELTEKYRNLSDKLVANYKNALDPYCKDLVFLVESYEDHDPGWSGCEDAESAMIYTLRNSKAKFQRIISQH